MKTFKEDFLEICQKEHGVLIIMAINLLLSIVLAIYAVVHLNPDASVVKIGYGDIGGYRDGSWVDILSYPLLALIFGVLHSLLSVRVFHKRGSGMTKFFLIITTMLILGTFLVLIRVLGEG